MAIVVAIAGACFGFLMFLYGIVMGLMLPAAYARVAVEDTIGAGLAFGEVFGNGKEKPGDLPTYSGWYVCSKLYRFIGIDCMCCWYFCHDAV